MMQQIEQRYAKMLQNENTVPNCYWYPIAIGSVLDDGKSLFYCFYLMCTLKYPLFVVKH